MINIRVEKAGLLIIVGIKAKINRTKFFTLVGIKELAIFSNKILLK